MRLMLESVGAGLLMGLVWAFTGNDNVAMMVLGGSIAVFTTWNQQRRVANTMALAGVAGLLVTLVAILVKAFVVKVLLGRP